MVITALFAFLTVGIIAGLIAGLLGLSGGVVTVPCLVLIFHFLGFQQDLIMHMAIGTSLSAMILTGIASTLAHHWHKGVVWNIVLIMIPGIIVGCLLGAYLAHFLSGILLQILFGMFICSLGAYLLLQKKKTAKQHKKPHQTMYTWYGVGIGTLASLLGIGGGVFMVPLLISNRFTEAKAVGTSAATSLLITSFASLAYLFYGLNAVKQPWSFGYIYLPAFAAIGVATIVFAPIGARIAHKMDGKLLRKVFAGTLVFIGILMIFN